MFDDKFFDTSILVYAFDRSELEKHAAIMALIEDMYDKKERPVISIQVLLELYNVLTRFITNPITAREAIKLLDDFFESPDWIKLNYTASTAKHAIAIAAGHKLKIWDVLIAETMKENDVYTIITENEKDFKKIPGIKVINPFK